MRCTQAVVFLHVMHHDGGQIGGECKKYGQGEKMCQLTGMAHDLSNKDT